MHVFHPSESSSSPVCKIFANNFDGESTHNKYSQKIIFFLNPRSTFVLLEDKQLTSVSLQECKVYFVIHRFTYLLCIVKLLRVYYIKIKD